MYLQGQSLGALVAFFGKKMFMWISAYMSSMPVTGLRSIKKLPVSSPCSRKHKNDHFDYGRTGTTEYHACPKREPMQSNFSFTKYGTVKASVDNVSANAVTDEKKGSYYPATLALEKKDMLIDGKHIPISPGMNVTAEIKTGKRRIVEFLLSPVQKAGNESLRER